MSALLFILLMKIEMCAPHIQLLAKGPFFNVYAVYTCVYCAYKGPSFEVNAVYVWLQFTSFYKTQRKYEVLTVTVPIYIYS